MDGVFITIPMVWADTSPFIKTAISLPELVRQTNAFSSKYRPGCTPRLLDSNPKALFLHYNVKCNKKDSDPGGHDVRIQFDVSKVQKSQQAKDLDVQVSCSCPAFLYWGAQWNLHQRDGLLGTPRPELLAPTERLELRGNYVICKHIHSMFERILPSVQHNIVNLLREREIRKKKQDVKDTPERLKEKQEEMRKRKEMEKIRKTKDKEVRDKLLEALKNEEQARLLHEQQLENQGGAPGDGEVEREGPAVEMGKPEHRTSEEADLKAIEDLSQQEEENIAEAHEKGTPHLHKGLPYEIEEPEEDEKLIHKFESQHTSALARDLKPGTRVSFLDAMDMKGAVEKVQHDEKDKNQARVTVKWDDRHRSTVAEWQLVLLQKKLFHFAEAE